MQNPETLPRSEWTWQLLIRIPDAVTATDLKRAGKELLEKKQIDTSRVTRWTWKEGQCVQLMHVGPYDEVGRSYQQLDDYAGGKGLRDRMSGARDLYQRSPASGTRETKDHCSAAGERAARWKMIVRAVTTFSSIDDPLSLRRNSRLYCVVPSGLNLQLFPIPGLRPELFSSAPSGPGSSFLSL